MNISKFKLVWKYLTGGKEAVLDYVLDVANTLVQKISTARQEEIKGYLATAVKILDKLDSLSWLCPAKWKTAYKLTVDAFANVVKALTDLNVTAEEIDGIVTAFQSAYCAWRTDDSTAAECAGGACSEAE